MFSEQATVPEKANPVGRWAARTVLVLFLLLILGLINNSRFIGLTNWIPHPIIGRIWLPLFDLCMYVLLWLGWWLYRVLSLDVGAEESEFPDIDSDAFLGLEPDSGRPTLGLEPDSGRPTPTPTPTPPPRPETGPAPPPESDLARRPSHHVYIDMSVDYVDIIISGVREKGVDRATARRGLPSENRAVRSIKAIARRASLILAQLISRDWRRTDPVDCTVFAPPSVVRGDWLLVQVFTHRPDQAEEARDLAQEIDQQAQKRGFKSLEIGIKRGTRLTFHLHVPGIEFPTSMETLIWQGRPTYVHFAAKTPSEFPIGTVIGRVTVSQDSIPIGSIMFRLDIVEKNGPSRAPNTLLSDTYANRRSSLLPVGDEIRRYKMAFISYAMKDLPEVIKRVQMLRLARIRYFQDVLKLEPGDRWERKLYRHIDRSDLFLLFWSTNAKESKWVLEEARYAIKRKGDNEFAPPEIFPVIIEGPPVPEPPKELAHLHFNDYLIYFMIPQDKNISM